MLRVEIKTAEDEKEAWRVQATASGYKSLSEWMRDVLNNQCDEKPSFKLPQRGKYDRGQTSVTTVTVRSMNMNMHNDSQIRKIITEWNEAVTSTHEVSNINNAVQVGHYLAKTGYLQGIEKALDILNEWDHDENIPKDYADYHAPITAKEGHDE